MSQAHETEPGAGVALTGAAATAWVGITGNPASGRGESKRQVARLVEALRRHQLDARIAWTPDERAALVAEATPESGCRCLVAVGGDGTVAALVNERPCVPITVLPAGTENLFARHFGLKRHAARLAATIDEGRVVPLDLGRIGTRRFTLMAGIGFDADVVTRHHAARHCRAGQPRPTHRLAYVEPVLRASFEYRFPALEVAIADPGREETFVGSSVFLFNLPRYALGLPFAPLARGDDGWLDLVVFRDPGPLPALRYLWMVLRGIHLYDPGVFHRKVRRVCVRSTNREPVPVQLDGDPGGHVASQGDDAWTVEVLPRAIEVLVPRA